MSLNFLTGRQRRINYHGSYSGRLKFVYDTTNGAEKHFHDPGGGAPLVFTGWSVPGAFRVQTSVTLRLDRTYTQGLGASGIIEGIGEFVAFLNDPTTPILAWYNADGTEKGRATIAFLGLGHSVNDSSSGGFDALGGTITDTVDFTSTCDWQYIVDVEEVMKPNYTARPHDGSNFFLNGRDFSEIESAFVFTAPWNWCAYFEVTRPGGTVGLIKGATDLTSTISTRAIIGHEYWPVIKITASSTAGESASCSCSALWEGGAASSSPQAASATGSWGSVDQGQANSTGANTATSESWFPVPGRTVLTAVRQALDTFAVDSMTVQWTDNLGTSLAGITDAGTGSVSRTIGAPYRESNMHGTITTTGSLTGQGGGAIGCRLSDSSITATDSTLATFCLRGQQWDQFSLQQVPLRYYAKQTWQPIVGISSSSPGWKPLLGIDTLTFTGSGQFLRIAVGASTGFGAGGMQLQGYDFYRECRFIGIRVRSVGSANQPFALYFDAQKLGNDVTDADGVWKEYLFDLYAVDPIKTALATNKWYATEPATFVNLLVFKDLANSKTYEIEWIRGEVHNHSLVSVYGALICVADTLPVYRARFDQPPLKLSELIPLVRGLTGEQPSSLEFTNLAPPPGGSPDITDNFDDGTSHYYPIADWQQSDNMAVFLEGDGLLNGGGVSLDRDAKTAPITLRAVHLALGITVYPGAGDVIGQSAYGQDTNLWFGLPVRSGLFGGVIGGGTPDVVLEELNPSTLADVSEAGRGSPLIDEYYRTLGPYARAVPTTFPTDPNHRAFMDPDLLTGGPNIHMGNLALRWILWASVGGGGLSQDISPAGLHVRAHGEAGRLRVGFRRDFPGASWSDADAGIAGDTPCIRFDPSSDYHRLYMSYIDGSGVIKLAHSDDGGTWTVATTVNGSGDNPAFDITPWGVQMHLWRTAGGAIDGKILDPQGNVMASGIVAVASGVDDAPLTVAYDPAGDRFFLLYRVSGVITLVKSTDGVTWV